MHFGSRIARFRLAWATNVAVFALIASTPTTGCAGSGLGQVVVRVKIAVPALGEALNPRGMPNHVLSLSAPDSRFDVVIENVSTRPILLYTDGSSWGDPTLSFELTDSEGQRTKVYKQILAYTKNAPSTLRLGPGEVWVRAVYPNRTWWSGWPKHVSAPGRQFSLVAVLEQTIDKGVKTEGLWSGKSVSDPISITLVSP